MQLTKQALGEITLWVHRNARSLDLALWQNSFEGGPVEAVLAAMADYQNEDGGFGHALEADSWNPYSSPYTTIQAVNLLRSAGFTDASHPLLAGALRYFASGEHLAENGWCFSIPGNNEYPHAPWWTYDPEANNTENIGVTLTIAAFALRSAAPDSALWQTAARLARLMVERLYAPGGLGDMGIDGYIALLQTLEGMGRTDIVDLPRLAETLHVRVDAAIVRDPAQWPLYGVRPSNFIRSPESPYYAGNEAIVAQELDFLLSTREPEGVWPITWSWFDLNERYAKQFAISENWWKTVKARENLLFLRAFGRVEA